MMGNQKTVGFFFIASYGAACFLMFFCKILKFLDLLLIFFASSFNIYGKNIWSNVTCLFTHKDTFQEKRGKKKKKGLTRVWPAGKKNYKQSL